MNIAEKIQNMRKLKKMTQEDLAESLGVSRQAISKWENGLAYPETEKLIMISKFFEISMDDLIHDKVIESNNSNDSDDEEKFESFIIGGFIIGIALGFITGNFMYGLMGGVLGLGAGYVIKHLR